MTRNEILAYNAGVSAVLALALRCSQTIEPKLTTKPTRYNFAIGALNALADEGHALLMAVPPGPSETDPLAHPHEPGPQPHEGALVGIA